MSFLFRNSRGLRPRFCLVYNYRRSSKGEVFRSGSLVVVWSPAVIGVNRVMIGVPLLSIPCWTLAARTAAVLRAEHGVTVSIAL